jgi:translocon-associated protein subunit alpha
VNKGDKDIVVDEMLTSLRYPQDFSFVIQNYTAAKYARTIEAGHEGTFDYAFVVSETYAGRPLGLYVSLLYTDSTGKKYQHTVFNDTITVVEDESFSHETGFLYFVFACLVIIGLLLGQQFLTKLRRRAGISTSTKSKIATMTKSQPMETGTNGNNGDVDMSWIPREVLQAQNKSPGRSPNSTATKRREQKAKLSDD